jgi:hypothetical protein
VGLAGGGRSRNIPPNTCYNSKLSRPLGHPSGKKHHTIQQNSKTIAAAHITVLESKLTKTPVSPSVCNAMHMQD